MLQLKNKKWSNMCRICICILLNMGCSNENNTELFGKNEPTSNDVLERH